MGLAEEFDELFDITNHCSTFNDVPVVCVLLKKTLNAHTCIRGTF